MGVREGAFDHRATMVASVLEVFNLTVTSENYKLLLALRPEPCTIRQP